MAFTRDGMTETRRAILASREGSDADAEAIRTNEASATQRALRIAGSSR